MPTSAIRRRGNCLRFFEIVAILPPLPTSGTSAILRFGDRLRRGRLGSSYDSWTSRDFVFDLVVLIIPWFLHRDILVMAGLGGLLTLGEGTRDGGLGY